MQRTTQKTGRSIEQVFAETSKILDSAFGIPSSYRIELLPRSVYIDKRISEVGREKVSESIAYPNYEREVVFVNEGSAVKISETRLAGYLAYYAMIFFAFKNSSQRNKQHFDSIATLPGVAAYFQSILKDELSSSYGYLPQQDEKERLAKFFDEHPTARIGRDISEKKYEQSGQRKIARPIFLKASRSENFDVSVHEIDGISYVQLIKETLEPGEFLLDQSKDREITELTEFIHYVAGQRKQLREAIPALRRLPKLLDPRYEAEEIAVLSEMFGLESEKRSNFDLTQKLQDIPEYEKMLQPILIKAESIHNRPTLENPFRKDERKYFAVIL